LEVSRKGAAERRFFGDPDFWDVWTGKSECSIDWKAISSEWTG